MAALLGALQGVAEFLPISSSGHLCLAQAWLGISADRAGHTFNIVVHAGTLLAVLWTYRGDLGHMLRVALRPTLASPERSLLVAVILGTLPLGLVLLPGVEAFVVHMEQRVRWVGVALLITAGMLTVASRLQRRVSNDIVVAPLPWQAFVVGMVQLFAVLPGISRSGSTIVAGLLVGLHPTQAAAFSFLLSVPAVLGATVKELTTLGVEGSGNLDVTAFALGFATSLSVGLMSLGLLLRIVNRGRLGIFVPYLLVVGTIAIVLG